jgi:hypothetical protein
MAKRMKMKMTPKQINQLLGLLVVLGIILLLLNCMYNKGKESSYCEKSANDDKISDLQRQAAIQIEQTKFLTSNMFNS